MRAFSSSLVVAAALAISCGSSGSGVSAQGVCTSDQACQPTNPCTTGTTFCSTSSADPVCRTSGNKADGTSCGGENVCSEGSCVPPGKSCVDGRICQPANPCGIGTLACTSSTQPGSCITSGTAPDGTSCGTGLVCVGGSCEVACVADQACQPSNPCSTGKTACASATATPACNATGNKPDGTSCGTDQVCSSGTCKGPVGTIAYFAIAPAPDGTARSVNALTAGPDGAVWFTLGKGGSYSGQIGRVAVDGSVTVFSTPGNPDGIAAGPDGNLWVADNAVGAVGNQIYRVTTAGSITEYSLYDAYPTTRPAAHIAAGADGALWFTTSNAIGKISTAGAITEWELPAQYGQPTSIAACPDAHLWFSATGQMGRVAGDGTIAAVASPSATGGVAAGPAGDIWFTTTAAAVIGHIDASGQLAQLPAPGATGSITAGPDGNMWFTEPSTNKIGRITPGGAVTEFPTQTPSRSIAAGSDGNVWFGQDGSVGRITAK